MAKAIQVSTSILCADFTRLGDEIKKCEDAGVDMIHVDVMDGHFVPVISIGDLIVKAIRPLTKLPIEAHLMVENPWTHIDSYIDAGADIISIHSECYGERTETSREFGQYPKGIKELDIEQARGDILKIKQKGAKAFMVINPETPLCVQPLVNDLDGVLIMSVNPGFAKQKFMPVALPKIAKLREIFDGDISIDGGVNDITAPEAVKAGANVLATASYFFGAKNPKDAVKFLKNLGFE